MKKPFFTIIIVSYNPGNKLIETVESVKKQTYCNYRILIKDGMSTDGSLDKLREKLGMTGNVDEKGEVTIIESCDNGIYHAMNIAASHLNDKVKNARAEDAEFEDAEKVKILRAGELPSYIFFLNCGDTFRDENVLRKVHDHIISKIEKSGTTVPSIFYGDTFDCMTGYRVASNPKIDDFACYRNVPSHQACFYDERLIYRNPFELKYKVRADYEHFLRCFYKEKAQAVYMPVIVANYEGGGFSDVNKKMSEEERRDIIKMYLPVSQIRKYDIIRIFTFAALRTALSSNKLTSGVYNTLKSFIYKLKEKRN
ncbi:glycosyltransferase [Butyrivibrio sp. INlla21]|uniref:glycosyltransferase n=1 Tax=Butyrivibrio sp. INlla21 TaxID=1520811 RepID=UPI0008F20BE6|nr:glycosyltransferase [Butyrivibrio sp. INlla21]SFU68022.1 Glycosyltransferase involved in cell wall bisynthesis [Butyrivibrio sp. INlla21]